MLLASVFQRTFTTLALGLAGLNVQAQTVLPLETRSLYLQAGVDQQSTRAWTVGLTLPWADWQRTWGGGTWRGHWDLYASQWTSDGYTGRVHSHVAGSYGAGYYGYLWSLVVAMDLRTAFAADRLNAAVGKRYRDTVLSQGGQREPAQLVREFLGRDTNPKAFYDYLKK